MERPGRDQVYRGDALAAVGEVESVDVLAVAEDLGDDLTEAQGDQSQVVALEAERGGADEDAPQRAERRAYRKDQPEVDVDAGAGADGGARDVHVPLGEEGRHDPPGHVPADRPERDVA